MAAPVAHKYPSPLAGFETAPPLPADLDAKTPVNPEGKALSEAYDRFTAPLDNGQRGGFDVHIYYFQWNAEQTKYARELWERIRREFPELRIYKFWDRPVGPHPVAMFEVNVFTPHEFGAFVAWLAVWRGPLSVLIHPNTIPGEGETPLEAGLRDHTQGAIWMGERFPLDVALFQS
ncbi:uncharacterized protein UV8b_04971 [Ustilaginoidea virens]|uniref:Dopa 4,5-dioxygenase n=1 Tax=Ustilaginoidea virens TaxID=1159556 RepID=A0A1B5L703_USTVR|nr:uncharacterized protein UV8b_04971 [Ustilaginoidea virens]QUC20730.1 hypothetical protein UV8b_04971 [Ustilaginoidea virens]GAO19273.1 hypothetical protein UVI_02062530 [Ustilaginoidea virens]